jgi:hypothetical protein
VYGLLLGRVFVTLKWPFYVPKVSKTSKGV